MTQLTAPSPLRVQTPPHMVFDAGAIFFDVSLEDEGLVSEVSTAQEFSEVLDRWIEEGKELGATNGGSTLTRGLAQEDIDTDDRRVRVIGLTRPGEAHATLSTTIHELHAENIMRASPTAFRDPETNAIKWAIRTLGAEDHKNVVIVNFLGANAGYKVGCVYNAYNQEALEMTINDQGVADASITFVGTASDPRRMSELPASDWTFPNTPSTSP